MSNCVSVVCSLRSGAWRVRSRLSLCLVLLVNAATLPEAKGALISPYQLSAFTLTNSSDSDGFAGTPDSGSTLILTGPNSGSGSPGTTDLFTFARGTGLVRFSYQYASADLPSYDYAGYLLGANFFQLADIDGVSGSVSVPVLPGFTFGFRVGTLDNTGEPGVLTVRDFSAPNDQVPEPGSFYLVLIAAGAFLVIRRRRLPRSLSVLAVVASVSATLMAQNQAVYTGQSVTGQFYLSRVVNLREQAAIRSISRITTTIQETKPKAPPNRLRPSWTSSPSIGLFAKAAANVQPSKSLAVASAPNSFGFPGLSHRDQRLANGGNQWSVEPPNLNIAVANNFVLQGVNNAVQVFDLSGAPTLPLVLASNQVFGLAPAIDFATDINGPYLTDMRVFYDQGINRWFIIQRGQDNNSAGDPLNQSHLYLAVSRTADPTGDYNIYIMDTTNSQNRGCPCIADYPQIGSDQYGLHIAWNEFGTYNEQFVDAAVLSISKSALAAGSTSPNAFRFLIPAFVGYEFALQPATTPPGASNFLGNGGVAYFVSSRSGSGSQVALWAMTNTSSLATQTPNPTLYRIFVPTLTYYFPSPATQRPGPRPYGESYQPVRPLPLIDGGDCRVQAVSYAGGRLFLTLQTAVTDELSNRVVGGAYIVMSPTLRSGVLAATVLNQGYLFVNKNHILRPALAVNAQGRGAIAATLVGPDWFPSAAFIPLETYLAPSVINVASLGTAPEDGFTGYPDYYALGVARWGDYNSAVAASDGSIWLGSQFIGSYLRTEFANWNTFVMLKKP